ncbi:MAG: XTP/dITP diphosphatase [Clostridia bacterium]|nr:XTP/dITP diphosphatase [Clostridia bacterium]
MELIIATNNQGKVREFKNKLKDYEVFSLKDKGIDIEVEEDGTTFEENAIKKARAVCDLTGKMTIADDSGLEVFALDNAPGIYSARYGGEGLSDKQRYIKLLEDMENKTERGARFVSVIAICYPDGRDVTLRGECYGEILKAPDGDGGFGYDPVFYYPPLNKTFGTLTLEEKNEVSHRARALEKLERFFTDESVVLGNGVLHAEIVARGAEVRKLVNVKNGEDLLNTDFKVWNYTAPALFPVLGKTKDEAGYYYGGKHYDINPHGFARESVFKLVHASETTATYVLCENENTLKSYPFAFRFYVTHTLEENFWKVAYKVENTDNKALFFNLGSHEAYKLGDDWENYFIEYEKEENLKENILKTRAWMTQKKFGTKEKVLPIYNENRNLFYFSKDLNSSWVQLNYKNKPIVRVHYDLADTVCVGLWRARKGNFYCIEPWFGVADSRYESTHAEEKEGLNWLQPGASFERKHKMEFFL